jgi:RHS repeat-associated protein
MHHFTGKERDTESGNDFMFARYYNSNTGRFLSPDPLYIEMHRLADPQQLNLYMYGRNNPLGVTDPTGLDITCGGTRCADYLRGLQKDIKGFKIGYDNGGKVVTVGDIDKKLSKSDKAFLSAIDDSKHHVTINAIDGSGDSSVFFGAANGATHTIAFGQAAMLDGPKNAGGMTSASLAGHETLEGYKQSLGYSHAGIGFPGFTNDPPPVITGSMPGAGGTTAGYYFRDHIEGTSTNETIGMKFVTPIPTVDYNKGAAGPAYPVSVERTK